MHVFKKNVFEIFIGKYSDKFIIIFFIIIFLVETFNNLQLNCPKTTLYVGIPISIFIWILAEIIYRKFAYKIIFDSRSGEAIFCMFREKEVIKTRIYNIKEIYMGAYMNFHFDGKVIKYKGYDDLKLMEFIDKSNIPVKYNKIGRLLTGRDKES